MEYLKFLSISTIAFPIDADKQDPAEPDYYDKAQQISVLGLIKETNLELKVKSNKIKPGLSNDGMKSNFDN